MKTYKERTESILQKTKEATAENKKKTAKTWTVVGVALAAIIALNLVLFIPYNTQPTSVAQHQDSKYYRVIKKLNELNYTPPRYKNNFEAWSAALDDVFSGCGAGQDYNGGMAIPETDAPNASDRNGYVETTDNQVAGVIEGDLFKRTDEYIFYYAPTYYKESRSLRVYSIAGEDSRLISQTALQLPDGFDGWYGYTPPELYLSQDGENLYLVQESYARDKKGWTQAYTAVLSYDVSNPETITLENSAFLSGSYITSRYVDGKMLLITSCVTKRGTDFSEESEFIPQYGEWGQMQSVAAEDVYCPDTATNTQYAAIYVLGGEEMQVQDSAAFLSYSTDAYVSKENIFIPHEYTQTTAVEGDNSLKIQTKKTEISCISYTDGLQFKGKVTVDGDIKNQYAMDEYQGYLRVVTTTEESQRREGSNGNNSFVMDIRTQKNASLYCVDLSDFTVKGSVEKFAPDGESAESVRFDKEKAYVCTAEIVQFTDPVYAFNLSDVQNITYVDTGVIAGYSTSLVNFTDGYLLGIGYGETGNFKLEIYKETENNVEQVCSVERDASFSEDYKSYFIDRERGLIGLGLSGYLDPLDKYNIWDGYLLFQFDGVGFTQLLSREESMLNGDNAYKRATLIDGYFYYMSAEDFRVAKIH